MTDKTPYRVLFVDDELNILNGLKRVLRPIRSAWVADFALSGAEALRFFDTHSYDLIVSDMRMPGMDGAQLLENVRRRSPQTVRCILSGHSEKGTVLKTIMHAHQYLSKPTDQENIISLMDRVTDLLSLLRNPEIRKLVSAITALPSLPECHSSLMAAIDSEDSCLADIGALIAKDIGMSSNVLKLVNSAFFGHSGHISELSEAVSWLGLELLKALALTVGLFSAFNAPASLASFHKDLMRHCLATGLLAKRISSMENQGKAQIDEAFLSGLLHDLGKLALAYLAPEKYTMALQTVREKKISLSEAEESLFGASHAEVGGYIAGLWGMHLCVVEAIAFHHHPAKLRSLGFSSLMAVHVANVLAHEAVPDGTEVPAPMIDMTYIEKNGKGESIPGWRKLIENTEREI
jgi:HD-like signal output (HDOD) protein/ActR/RegA family two-component response regulator